MKTFTCIVILSVLALSYASPKPKYTEAELKKVFEEYDCTHDGKLSLEEVEQLAAAYGIDKATAKKLFEEADKNKDNEIEYDEFKAAAEDKKYTKYTKEPNAPKPCTK